MLIKPVDFHCPNCSTGINVYLDDFFRSELTTYYGDHEPQEVECSECGHTFFVEEFVQRSYEVRNAG